MRLTMSAGTPDFGWVDLSIEKPTAVGPGCPPDPTMERQRGGRPSDIDGRHRALEVLDNDPGYPRREELGDLA